VIIHTSTIPNIHNYYTKIKEKKRKEKEERNVINRTLSFFKIYMYLSSLDYASLVFILLGFTLFQSFLPLACFAFLMLGVMLIMYAQ